MNEVDQRDYVARRIAASGVLSRRQAAAAVRAGRVRVDSETVFNALTELTPDAQIELDGTRLPAPARRVVYILNKPRGWICSARDRFSEKLAWRLLPELPGVRWFSAGRLDAQSEGLIVFTNSGALAHTLEDPTEKILKYYQVTTSCALSDAALAAYQTGIVAGADGEILRARAVTKLADGKYVFILNEGRRHEIRRMVQAGGATVRKLVRFQIGALSMNDLAPGAYRELQNAEIAALTMNETANIAPKAANIL